MKKLALTLALILPGISAAEDEWVAVGQVPAAKPATSEAASTQYTEAPSIPSDAPAISSQAPSLQAELLLMVETMQQEIAELRGIVEEQNHQIEQLKKLQQQRYIEMDRRLSTLFEQKVSQPENTSNTAVDADAVSVEKPEQVYRKAMAFIKQKQFAEALQQLDKFAKGFPEHKLAANALYWSGEVQLTEKNYDVAILQFTAVVEQHAGHNKVADSHYKLAVAYDRKGDSEQAKKILQQVIKQYPDAKSVNRLASRYLERLNTPQ